MTPRRGGAVALLLAGIVAGAASVPALAQTALRLEPSLVHFDGTDPVQRREVSIWADNVPAPGIASFTIAIDAAPREPAGTAVCMTVESVQLDPDLGTAWNDHAVSNVSKQDRNTVLIWQAFASSQQGKPLPTGSIRLGHVVYVEESCEGQGDYWVDPGSRWGASLFGGVPFDMVSGAPWFVWPGTVPDIDLTVACDRTAPVVGFVDGDSIDLSCTVSNHGSDPFGGRSPLLLVAASDDAAFDPGSDTEIARSLDAGALEGG
jgi:hypothetical protein